MRQLIVILVFAFICVGCESKVDKKPKQERFPKAIEKVFNRHGGLEKWKRAQALRFEKGAEVHTANLWSRKTKIVSPKYTIGFDGDSVWIQQVQEKAFRGNPDFYYNLYFYFYAMPFVLADEGIRYEKIPDLRFEGMRYPGFKISYNENIGTSPDDNYFIYFNPKTFQMEWLGYTVTYYTKKPSTKSNIIRYNNWNDINGLLLPKSITWYKKK